MFIWLKLILNPKAQRSIPIAGRRQQRNLGQRHRCWMGLWRRKLWRHLGRSQGVYLQVTDKKSQVSAGLRYNEKTTQRNNDPYITTLASPSYVRQFFLQLVTQRWPRHLLRKTETLIDSFQWYIREVVYDKARTLFYISVDRKTFLSFWNDTKSIWHFLFK